MSEWYRCESRWRNGVHELRPGTTYTLDDEFAGQLLRDSPGCLRRLTEGERAEVAAGLSYASEAVGQPITPPGPDRDATGENRGGGEAMHTGNSGLVG